MRPFIAVASLLGACAVSQPTATPAPPPTPEANWEVHFSPAGGCTEQTVRYIAAARRDIQVQAYSFTSRPIADALIERARAGVDVEIVLDKSDVHSPLLPGLADARVAVRIDRAHAIAHNKVMIVDGAVVLTGSFNFTAAAEEHNAENCLAIRDGALARAYADNWQKHHDHSEAL